MDAGQRGDEGERRDRTLRAIEELMRIAPGSVHQAMDHAAHCISQLTLADKVDVFLLEPATSTLVAVGTSDTPLGRKQKALGLDRLALANGGRAVEVFQTGKSWLHNHQDEDPGELHGVRVALAIRSHVGVPLDIGGARRGVLSCTSQQPDFFTPDDVHFLTAVAHWVGLVAHRAELGEALAKALVEQGRRMAADELITVLAHDMGNHLMPIQIRLELIHRRALRDQTLEYARDAEIAGQALTALRRLISDLMDVGRLEQGLFSLELHPVDLVALAGDVAHAATLPHNPVQLTGVTELVVQADSNRLRQALENLVANALRFSPRGRPVTLHVTSEQRTDGAYARVSVTDEGPGIAPDMRHRLFERFARGSGSKGLGLGLFLVRSIAEAHGGSLTVESEPGQGASFSLALPMDDDEPGA